MESSREEAFTNGKMEVHIEVSLWEVEDKDWVYLSVRTETSSKENTARTLKMVGASLPGPTGRYTKDSSETI